MREEGWAVFGWLYVVSLAFAAAAAVAWVRASIAYHQHPGSFEDRLPEFVRHAALGCGFAGVAIGAYGLSKLPAFLSGII